LQLLTPDPAAAGSTDATEVDGSVLLGVGAVIAALIASQAMGGGGSSPVPSPKPAPTVISRPAPAQRQSDGQFSLLNQYMKQD
jgi:hypothetical protein